MPTLSQWKILSRLLLKKSREAIESAKDEQNSDEEGRETEEDITGTGRGSSPLKQEQISTKELYRLPKSPVMMMAEKMYQSIPEESASSSSHPTGRHEVSGQALGSPRDNFGPSRSIVSPKSLHRFRPKSGKSLPIQDALEEDPKGESDTQDSCVKSSQQESPKVAGTTNPFRESALGKNSSVPLTADGLDAREFESPLGTICAKEASFTGGGAPADGESNDEEQPPRQSCLKRSDSCFIRRPDSRAKSVTFGRPFSSTQLYSDNPESNANICSADKKALDTTHASMPSKTIQKSQNGWQTANRTIQNIGSNIDDKQATTSNSTRLKRPSSSGPTFWRAVQMVAVVNKVALTRKASFPVDWQTGGASSPFFNVGEENNLPRPPAFRVRRDSIVTRNFSVGSGLGRAVSPHGIANPSSLASGLKVTSNTRKEGEGFEPYVIQDGQLVKRNLKSPKNKDVHEKPEIGNKSPRVGNSKDGVNESKVPEKHTYTRMESQQDLSGTNVSNPFHTDNELSRASLNDSGVSQVGQLEDRPSSRSRVSTPTTMVALVKAMGIGQGKGDPPLSDGSGALRRWSKVHQAIVSADQLEDTPKESLLDRHAQSSVHMDELNATEQEELQKLGFRKPAKHKKKKKKKKVESSGATKSGSVSAAQRRQTINLKEDPVLIKVGKKNQNVGKFTEPPEPKPNAVCFEVLGTDLSHGEVKAQVERLIRNCPGVKLVEIQFHHRALVNNIKEMHNRWIITTNSIEGRNRLAGATVNFPGLQVQLRRYDDIVNTEYQQFTRMTNFAKMMVTRLGNGTK